MQAKHVEKVLLRIAPSFSYKGNLLNEGAPIGFDTLQNGIQPTRKAGPFGIGSKPVQPGEVGCWQDAMGLAADAQSGEQAAPADEAGEKCTRSGDILVREDRCEKGIHHIAERAGP